MKQAVKKRTVFQEEMAKVFINSKDTVTVRALDELESHGVGSVLAIFDAASWAEPAFATERNKFKVTAFGTGIHCTAESRVTAVNHFCYVINDSLTWMQDVYHFFVMVIKNVLEYVHKIIMTQKKKKENPTPQNWGRALKNIPFLF